MNWKELPSPFPGMRVWGVDCGNFHFVISHEDGTQLKPQDKLEWTGYTASYKSYKGRNAQAIRIDGLWQTKAEAEQACLKAWKQLRQPI